MVKGILQILLDHASYQRAIQQIYFPEDSYHSEVLMINRSYLGHRHPFSCVSMFAKWPLLASFISTKVLRVNPSMENLLLVQTSLSLASPEIISGLVSW